MSRKIFDGVRVRDMTLTEEADFNAALQVVDVPVTLTRRQFFQSGATLGLITEAEALSGIAGATIPALLENGIAALPTAERFSARCIVTGNASFNRASPLVESFRVANGLTVSQVDQIWIEGAKL
jgi:hypothetical protein